MDEIVTFLCETLANLLKIPLDEVDVDRDIVYDLEADSLDIVDLLVATEEKYGWYVPDSALIKMRTLGELAENIHANIQK